MWMSVLIVLTSGIMVLIFVAVALVTYAESPHFDPGPHGLSEVLYAFASASNNNGSAFAGLNANTLFYNLLTALTMLIGRFVPAVAALAMAGSLAKKNISRRASVRFQRIRSHSSYGLPLLFWSSEP